MNYINKSKLYIYIQTTLHFIIIWVIMILYRKGVFWSNRINFCIHYAKVRNLLWEIYSTAKTKGNSKCTWCARRSALYSQRLIVISALTSALHVHKGVTFRLGITVTFYFI